MRVPVHLVNNLIELISYLVHQTVSICADRSLRLFFAVLVELGAKLKKLTYFKDTLGVFFFSLSLFFFNLIFHFLLFSAH